MGFFDRSKKNEAAASASSVNPHPPSYEEKNKESASGSSYLPSNTALIISKKGMSDNMVVESASGPLFNIAINKAFIVTPENPTIQITPASEPSLVVATAEFITRSAEVIIRLPWDKRISPTQLLPGGQWNQSFLFPLVIGGNADLMEWKPVKDGAVFKAWQCLRCDTGDVVMEYAKDKNLLGKKMGQATWTADGVETGIAEGEKAMMVFAALMVVLEKERRMKKTAAELNFEEQTVELKQWTHQSSLSFN